MKKEDTVTLTLRIPISLKLHLEMAAHQDNRTVNGYVNQLLKQHMDEKKIGTGN